MEDWLCPGPACALLSYGGTCPGWSHWAHHLLTLSRWPTQTQFKQWFFGADPDLGGWLDSPGDWPMCYS